MSISMRWSRTGAFCAIARTIGKLTCLPRLDIPHGINTTVPRQIKNSHKFLKSEQQNGPRLQSSMLTWPTLPSLKHRPVHWVPRHLRTWSRTLTTPHQVHPLGLSRACSNQVARQDPSLGQGK
jgi:hypothetical protein